MTTPDEATTPDVPPCTAGCPGPDGQQVCERCFYWPEPIPSRESFDEEVLSDERF